MTQSTVQIISELVESCRNHDFTDIVVLHEHRGEPDGLVVCHLPYGPTAYFGLYNTVIVPLCYPLNPCVHSTRMSLHRSCDIQANVSFPTEMSYTLDSR